MHVARRVLSGGYLGSYSFAFAEEKYYFPRLFSATGSATLLASAHWTLFSPQAIRAGCGFGPRQVGGS